MTIPLLTDIVVILGLSLGVILLSHRARLPLVLGFLLTGVIAGPHGLGLIKAVHEVEVLAEVGVILLLFSIGIEFSLGSLVRIWRSVVLGGSLQVVLTGGATFFLARAFGQTPREAVFMGMLVSLSSTAIVLRLLQDRAEIDAPPGRSALGVLIFQDMAIVPMMLFTPLLGVGEGDLAGPLLALLGKGALIVGVVLVGARWVVPWLLFKVARTRNREVFLLATVGLGLAAAWLTSLAGLSLALGAFLAGLVISESEYSTQALGEVLPFKAIFLSFFFVSVGMLLDVSFVAREFLSVSLIALLVLGLKAGVAALAIRLLGLSLRTALIAGLALSQVGEFSFILSRVGIGFGLLPGAYEQLFLAVSVLTMAATPFVISAAPAVSGAIVGLPLPAWLKGQPLDVSRDPVDVGAEALEDHLIIVGFGVNGRNLARAARVAGIPYVVVETNPDTVRREAREGESIFFGDAMQPAILEHAGVERARVLVSAISDPGATRRITQVAKRMNPALFVLARTRYVQEMEPLFRAGADDVIPEEFETSVEILVRVLQRYLIPRIEIEEFVAEVRAGGYEMLRGMAGGAGVGPKELGFHLPDSEVGTVRVGEHSFLVGRTLGEVGLRAEYGVTLLAVQRAGGTVPNPPRDFSFEVGDLLIVFGSPPELANAAALARGADAVDG
ncbi:MAG: cation:proton antiporter domain-containing protein [Longimicrobiales bacterium]